MISKYHNLILDIHKSNYGYPNEYQIFGFPLFDFRIHVSENRPTDAYVSNIHRDFVLSKMRSMDIHNSIFRYSFIDS